MDDDYEDGDAYGVEMEATLCGGGEEWRLPLEGVSSPYSSLVGFRSPFVANSPLGTSRKLLGLTVPVRPT